jgi:uncharacterized protein YabE (DUF348 family)
LLAASLVYVAMDKAVTLTVDGKASTVHSMRDTVGGLIEAEGLTVSERDLVAPGLDAPLEDGDTIVVRYARPLTVTVDGDRRVYWTTELTVDSALTALGLRAEGAWLSASRSAPIGRDGLAIEMSTPKDVTLRVGGKKAIAVVTTALTVGELLAERDLVLGELDKLSIPAGAPVGDGMKIVLTRIEEKTVTRKESVPFSTTTRRSSEMFVGQTEVIREGKKGARTATYRVTVTNGKVTDRALLEATVLREPVSRIVRVGTKRRPAVSGSVGGGVDSLNWAALARCESGGNPRAVNPAGYYGLYQFSISTWRSVGGSGLPSDAPASEQTYRAKVLYKRVGASAWPTCGRLLFT